MGVFLLVGMKVFGGNGGFAYPAFAIYQQKQVAIGRKQQLVDAQQVVGSAYKNFRDKGWGSEEAGDFYPVVNVVNGIANYNITTG